MYSERCIWCDACRCVQPYTKGLHFLLRQILIKSLRVLVPSVHPVHTSTLALDKNVAVVGI